jgi:hypothetical protein
MTNVAGQRMEPAAEAASPLAGIRSVEKVDRTAKLEHAALRRCTWRSGRGATVTLAAPSGCSRALSGPMGW